MNDKEFWLNPRDGRYYAEKKGPARKFYLTSGSSNGNTNLLVFSSENEAESLGWKKVKERPERIEAMDRLKE